MYLRALTVSILLFFLPSMYLHAQLSLPKVPAERTRYDDDKQLIKRSEYIVRNDIRYIIKEGMVTTEKFNDRVVKFYPNGNIKEMVYVDQVGRKKAIMVCEYYPDGLPGSESEFHPTGELLKRTEFKYENGFLKEKTVIDQYGYVITRTTYEINTGRNEVVERIYGAPQMVTEKNVYVYSDFYSGKLLRHEKYSGEDIFQFKRHLIYSKDVLLKEEYYNPSGNKAFYLEYFYDTNNQLTEIEKVLLDGTRLKNTRYQYNDSGLITGKINYDRKGKMIAYYKYSYE